MNHLKKTDASQSGTLPFDLITFLAQDEERFGNFLALTGLGRQDFLSHLAEPAFQAMVLDQVMQDQSLVLEFTTAHGLPPDAVLTARRRLPAAYSD